MFALRSTHRAAWCLLLGCAALVPAADAKDLKLKAVKTQEQTLKLPEGSALPAVKKTADGTRSIAAVIATGTKLEVSQSTGEFVDWQPGLTINEAHKYSFRWTTNLVGFPAAEWQVGQGDAVLASGPISGPFQSGRKYQFVIDLKQALPAQPGEQPKHYWVRVVAQGQGTVVSSAVDLAYAKPGAASAFGFDHDMFAYNLTTLMQGKAIGWEFAVYDGAALKASGAGGFARLAPQAPMTADTRISIGSTSKTVTAAAVMRAIEILKAKGKAITIDSPIAPYLPSDWAIGPRVDQITFKDLLRHTSGLLPGKDLYDELKAMIAAGPTNANWNGRFDGANKTYCNCNFTLFRVILPYMVHGRAAIEGQDPATVALDAEIDALQEELQTAAPGQKPAIIAQIKQLQAQKKAIGRPIEGVEVRTAKLYVEFVQKEVLAKVGLSSVWINPKGPSELITYYSFKTPGTTFAGYTDNTALRGVGAGFWFMSAKEFGKFFGGLRSGKIISAASFQTMTANSLGMFMSNSDAGSCREHNGAFTYDGGAGMRGAWVMFPNGVTGVLYMNSVNPDLPAPQTILRTAFNAAFKLQQLAAQ